jgi:hypothetical protein
MDMHVTPNLSFSVVGVGRDEPLMIGGGAVGIGIAADDEGDDGGICRWSCLVL